AYGAYLFGQKDYRRAGEVFAPLDDLVVPSAERFELRRFPFTSLEGRHSGRVIRLSYRYSSVDIDQGAAEVYFSFRHLKPEVEKQLMIGALVNFSLRFNM